MRPIERVLQSAVPDRVERNTTCKGTYGAGSTRFNNTLPEYKLIMTKTTLSTFILFLTILPAYAQPETLISGDVDFGGFGGPVLKVSSVAGEPGVWVGGRGGFIMTFDHQHSLIIGGGGYGLANNIEADGLSYQGEQLYYQIGYGGFEIEYVNQPNRLIHFSTMLLVGAGGLTLRENIFDDDFDEPDFENDAFFVTEPAVNVVVNFTKFLRVGAGIGYRFTNGAKLTGFDDSDLSGPAGSFKLEFGSF